MTSRSGKILNTNFQSKKYDHELTSCCSVNYEQLYEKVTQEVIRMEWSTLNYKGGFLLLLYTYCTFPTCQCLTTQRYQVLFVVSKLF